MAYDFDEIIDRTGTNCEKWDIYKGRDIIPMWVADMDFKSPLPVINALKKRADHGIFGYTLEPDELFDAIVERMKRLYKWEIEKEWITFLPGLVSGINAVSRAFGIANDEIITTIPVYPPFLSAPENSGKKLISVPMIEKQGRFTLNFDEIEKSITDRTRLFILCSPHNPCGTVFTKDELTELSEICSARGVVVCSDEIHCDFILDEDKKHIPTASVSSLAAENTITLMAPSKTYNIPGLGCSFAIIPNREKRKRFTDSNRGILPHVNLMGLTAGLAALTECDDWLCELIIYLRRNRDLVEKTINGITGLKMNHVEATYLSWIDTKKTGIENPAEFFEKAGVGLSCGTYFGDKNFVRLNFGCPKSQLIKAMTRIEKAIEAL